MIVSKIKQFLIALLVVYLGFISSDIFWKYYTPEETSIPNDIIEVSTNSQTLPNGLFGIEKKAVPKKPTYTKVQKTRLDLTLIGIIKKQQTPLAIIKFANNQIQIYGIDDSIRGIATVKAIENDFVIINYNGKDEKLTIERKIDNSILQETNNLKEIIFTNPSLSENTPLTANKQRIANKKRTISIDVENKHSIDAKDKQILKRYLQQARTNPISLLDIINTKPHFVNGKLDGFIIFPIRETALFDKIGLKSRDIIIEINGIKLNNLSAALTLSKNLASETEFNMIIKRNNQLQNIYFNLD